MQRFTSIVELRRTLEMWRAAGERIAFVPTMGNLHAGHLDLVDCARKLGERVVVSIFVNPAQFGPAEDFERYPRTPEEDETLLRTHGVDALFMPDVREIYPHGYSRATRVEVPELSDILCGASRPGHFTGVATVVAKLFNIVQPQVAVFGQKDFQQLLVIRRMVADLCLPVEVVGSPTVRESDGLAMSSRNRYLSEEDRRRAPVLYRTLAELARELESGVGDFAGVEMVGLKRLAEAGCEPDYLSIRRSVDLALPNSLDRELVILAAVRLGTTRLIDNLKVSI